MIFPYNNMKIKLKEIIIKLKPIWPYIKGVLSIGLVISVIGLYLQFSDISDKEDIKTSFKNSILHEIQVARNTLDYTLAQRNQNIRNRPTFSLELSCSVSEVFADNPQLKTELTDLYRALSSVQASALELMGLLSRRDSNSTTIQNRENDIGRAIQLANIVGPKLADTVGKTWAKPPDNLTPEELVKYYEKTILIYSVATDNQVEFK